MKKIHLFSLLSVLILACGGDEKNAPADAAPGTPDAPGGGSGSMIKISGSALERTATGMSPVANAMIAGYQNGNDATPVATTMSDAQGMYTLMVPAAGGALDGYLKATKTGLKDSYLYPPGPITADTSAPINMIAPDTLNLLVLLAIGQGNQKAGNGLIALVVVDGATADSPPVAGATVTVTPTTPDTKYRYNQNNLPSGTATSTATDGTAYIFNVPAGVPVTVSAQKTGSTFVSHSARAVADQFTTTLITP